MNNSNFKKILSLYNSFFKRYSFSKYSRLFFNCTNNIVKLVSFDCPSSIIYCTYCIMPLYIPSEFIYYSYGRQMKNRINIQGKDTSDAEIATWIEMVEDEIVENAFMFFGEFDSPEKILKFPTVRLKEHMCCPLDQISLLRAYSFLYCGDFKNAMTAIAESQNLLMSNSTYTQRVRSNKLNELQMLARLVSSGEDTAKAFFQQVIETTSKLLN